MSHLKITYGSRMFKDRMLEHIEDILTYPNFRSDMKYNQVRHVVGYYLAFQQCEPCQAQRSYKVLPLREKERSVRSKG